MLLNKLKSLQLSLASASRMEQRERERESLKQLIESQGYRDSEGIKK